MFSLIKILKRGTRLGQRNMNSILLWKSRVSIPVAVQSSGFKLKVIKVMTNPLKSFPLIIQGQKRRDIKSHIVVLTTNGLKMECPSDLLSPLVFDVPL